MTILKDARTKRLYARMKGRMLIHNKCVSTKETHVNRTKGAPKKQKTESQWAKSRKRSSSIELRGTKKRVGTIKNISYFKPTTDQRKEIERKLGEQEC